MIRLNRPIEQENIMIEPKESTQDRDKLNISKIKSKIKEINLMKGRRITKK